MARATGAAAKNPARYLANDPAGPALGKPSAWLKGNELRAWTAFASEIPWLVESDRALVEIASVIRAKLMSGKTVGIQALNLLRQAVGQLGASPTDRSKVTRPTTADSDDAASRYF